MVDAELILTMLGSLEQYVREGHLPALANEE